MSSNGWMVLTSSSGEYRGHVLERTTKTLNKKSMTTEKMLEKLARAAAAKGYKIWLTFQHGQWELTVDIDGHRLRCSDPTLAVAVIDVFLRVFTALGRRRKTVK